MNNNVVLSLIAQTFAIKYYNNFDIDDRITICSIVERKVGVYKEIVEGDNNL